MSIDLSIPTKPKLVKRSFELPQPLLDQFLLYVEAAREGTQEADESLVLQAILERQLTKDRKFRQWLTTRPAQKAPTPTHQE
jgi:hypothetical protein